MIILNPFFCQQVSYLRGEMLFLVNFIQKLKINLTGFESERTFALMLWIFQPISNFLRPTGVKQTYARRYMIFTMKLRRCVPLSGMVMVCEFQRPIPFYFSHFFFVMNVRECRKIAKSGITRPDEIVSDTRRQ